MSDSREAREIRRMWASLSPRAQAPFFLAVFCTFASLGFLVDALSGGRYSPALLAFLVGWSGAFAMAIAWCVTRQRFRLLPLAVLAQVAVNLLLPRGAPLAGEGFAGRVALDAAGAIVMIVAGYIFFASFIAREGISALRIRTEVGLAREIHELLVPDIDARFGRYQAFGRALPASEVGGDLLDALESPRGLIAYLADVTGHGVPAGMLSAMTKAAGRMRLRAGAGPGELLADLHSVLFPLKRPGMFVTCAVVELGADGGGRLALAGHPPALRYSAASGRVERLGAANLPLGVVESESFESAPLRMQPGDVLALVSDGLMDVFDAADREFGLDGIERVLVAEAGRPLPELGAAVFAAARTHGAQQDDQTLLLIRALQG
jgi:hypothetical protein